MTAELKDKRIVITGASRGLGFAFARACLEAGARVVINGVDADRLDRAAAALNAFGDSVAAVAGSVTESAVVDALVKKAQDRFGGLDVMVHNAGVVRDRTLLKMSVDDWDEVIAVHLRGAFLCTQAAARAMVTQGEGGQVVLVTSGSGLAGGFGQGNYAAAKEGMLGLLRTAVQELDRHKIRVNALWPVAATDMTQVVFDRAAAQADAAGAPQPSPESLGFGSPDEVAQGLVWWLSDDAARFNGQCLGFNGRRTALWAHPQEHYLHHATEPMSVADLARHYASAEPLPIARPRMAPDRD
ncbi:MAG: SDR family NAD(P)-dependent oxidoreductase [Pseudomonadota bacterium]